MPPALRRLACAIVAAAPLLLAAPGHAQQPAAPTGPSFYLTPYLWIAGIGGDISTPRQDVPDRNVEVSFRDTLSDLSGFAFMGAAEMRYGRFILIGDVMTLTVESDVNPRGALFSGGTGRVTTTTGTILVMARGYEDGTQAFDVGFGLRPWQISTRLSLDAGVLAGRTLKPTLNWTDPVFAFRYGVRFDETWGAAVAGDIGGFGAGSDLTWQIIGTVDYRINDWITMRVGYRHLQMETSRGGTDLDISLSGPIIGTTFRF